MTTITDEQKSELIGAWFSEEWAQEKARGMLDDYEALAAPATAPEPAHTEADVQELLDLMPNKFDEPIIRTILGVPAP